jgi:2-dehydropantoate 2-reductase
VSPPRIAVVGTGANGAAIGADLVRAGFDVTFVEQWPAHVEAMKANGIRVVTPEDDVTTPVRAVHLCEVATLREPFDIVFLLVKAYDTRWATELIRPLVAPDGVVVGLQNGMAAQDIVDVVGIDRAVGSVIEVSSNMFEPGIVHRQSVRDRSWFAVGGLRPEVTRRLGEVARVLGHAGTVEISDDIIASKWMKLVVNAAELGPSAILGLPLAEAAAVPGMRRFMTVAGTEAVRTAVAIGIRPRPIFGLDDAELSDVDAYAEKLFEAVLTHYTLADTKTTVLQDWMKGRRAEVDQINGLVVTEQRRLGGSAPANAITVALARRIEAGSLEMSPANIDLLLAGLDA